jgi:hypothetical protein
MTDWPEVREGNFLLLAFVLEYNDRLTDRVHALSLDFLNSTLNLRRDHNFVLREDIVFIDETKNVTRTDKFADKDIRVRSVLPSLVLIKTGNIDSTRNKHTLR